MKIVQFKSGSYGVRIGNWWNGYSFLDVNSFQWWDDFGEHIEFKTYEDALEILNIYIKRRHSNNYKSYKIIKNKI